MKWFYKLEVKYGRFAIKDLIKYVVILNMIVYLGLLYSGNQMAVYNLMLVPSKIFQGEYWRLITYIFIPPQVSPIWIIFVLYFFFIIGSGLEQAWGSFKLNTYYLIGMIGTTIASLIFGIIGDPTYINLSLFLAFARIYPNYQILLFFIIPIKIKYLAWLNWIYIFYTFYSGSNDDKVCAVVSILNYLIFFGKDIIDTLRNTRATRKRTITCNRKIEKIIQKKYFHKCTICGITENDDPKMDFRYCIDCYGDYEYCMTHLNNHEHKLANKVQTL